MSSLETGTVETESDVTELLKDIPGVTLQQGITVTADQVKTLLSDIFLIEDRSGFALTTLITGPHSFVVTTDHFEEVTADVDALGLASNVTVRKFDLSQ